LKSLREEINAIFDDSRLDILKKYAFPLIIACIVALLLAYYTSTLIDSVELLSNIEYQQEYLEEEIQRLQEDNANLQKEYFELKNLEPVH
jgi:uncharacterized membrane protein (DUF106 family)